MDGSSNLPAKQEEIKEGLFDKYFKRIKHPPRKQLRKLFGMVITNVERYREQNAEEYIEVVSLELDKFLNLKIEVRNGSCTVQFLPTGTERMLLPDKLAYVMTNEVRE